MRLLDTNTLEFNDFTDVQLLKTKYAILSHRWEPPDSELSEIVFEELDALTAEQRRAFLRSDDLDNLTIDQRRGLKIGLFCDVARIHGHKWAWVDTCCIDKRNSAELTEAINSMFRWYKQAETCYVYFNDVTWDKNDLRGSYAEFGKSKWFKRGWTLQELLAPRSLQCYDKDWKHFGDRKSLIDHFSDATGILKSHLSDQRSASVATKMSWSANRTTSRIEDRAYSLLGLFDINMPMLYGEGANAFLRLQRKIIKKTDDESIFAWSDAGSFRPHGMLAPSPSAFEGCGGIMVVTEGATFRRPYAMTNKGLELYVSLPPPDSLEAQHRHQTLTLGLNCERDPMPDGEKRYLAIVLHKMGDYWKRINCDKPCLYRNRIETTFQGGSRTWSATRLLEMRAIYIKQE